MDDCVNRAGPAGRQLQHDGERAQGHQALWYRGTGLLVEKLYQQICILKF
jgi:hypothetical protein